MTDGLVLVRSNGKAETRHPVRPEMLIGGSRGADLRIRESGIQRRHAVIEHFSSGLAIRSLGSRAEVLVNGERVSLRTLRVGDRISIGPAQFSVEESAPDPDLEPEGTAHAARSPAEIPEEPVPPQVLARVRRPETTPPMFSGPPMPRRRSVATHRSATFLCLAIVLADAIALGFYIQAI